MARIRVDASKAGIRKDWNSACEEFLRHCRIRNLSPHTAEYYREDLRYTQEILKFQYADELTKDKVDELVLHEMDKGNKVTAINSRLRGLRVFVHFCAEREYLDDFKYPLLKVDQEQKEPYTDEELRKLLKRPRTQSWNEWRCWAAVNMLLATGIRANTLVNMRVGDVDFKENTIFLQKLKNRKQQTLPLSSALRGVLQTYLKLWKWEKDTYLFPTYRLEFDLLLLCSIPEYNPFGETCVSKKQWSQITGMAEKAGGELLELVREADSWVKNVFAEFGVFTIIGL